MDKKKNLSGDLSRCCEDRTGRRIASYRRLTPPYLKRCGSDELFGEFTQVSFAEEHLSGYICNVKKRSSLVRREAVLCSSYYIICRRI